MHVPQASLMLSGAPSKAPRLRGLFLSSFAQDTPVLTWVEATETFLPLNS